MTFALISKFDLPSLQLLAVKSFYNKSISADDNARLTLKQSDCGGPDSAEPSSTDLKIFNPLAKTCLKEAKEAYKI